MATVHLATEGLSAAGKSEVGKLLEMPMLVFKVHKGLPEGISRVKFFKERVGDNPFLKGFYSEGMQEMSGYMSQMFFLHARVMTSAHLQKWSGGIAIEDRSIFGDEIYAENLRDRGRLRPESFVEYKRHRDESMRIYGVREPDGIILLDITLDTCLKRLKERETGETLDPDYWGPLVDLYAKRFAEIEKRIPTVRIDANIDFLVDESYAMQIADETNALVKRILAARKAYVRSQTVSQ
jgi:deoxyadenosine/deoxycytidine kinase